MKYCVRDVFHGAIAPSLTDRSVFGIDELGVDLVRGAEAVALLAGAVRGVEGEVPRCELVVAGTARGTDEVLAEREDLGLRQGAVRAQIALTRHELDLGHAFGELQRRLQRVGQPPFESRPVHEPVDHDLDRVLLVAGEAVGALQELGDVDRLTIDPSPHEALPGQVGEQRVVVALAAADHGCQHLEPGALRQQQHPIDDLLRCLALEPGGVVRAVLHADAGVEQPQVVVDLGDRADGRARVA